MEEFQTWLENNYNPLLSKSPSLSSSSVTTSQETHSPPTLCEDSPSFNSLESNASTTQTTPSSCNKNFPIPKVSHFCIVSTNTKTPQITCLAVQNNTLYAATLKEINVFDLETLSLLDTFGSGSGLVKSIAFGDKKMIFTAHQDCKIRVWQEVTISSSKQKHQLISTLPTLKDRFLNSFLPKNYVQIRRHKQKLWVEHADAVSGLAANDDVGLLYSVSWDKCFKIWKLSSDMRCLESVKAHSDAVNAIVVNPFDGTIYTGSADGDIKIWTSTTEERKRHKLLTALTKHDSSVNALALSKDGSVLFSGGGDGVILVWERDGNNNENNDFFVGCSLKGHKGAILCLVYVNGVVISGSSDRTVRIWKYGKDYGGWCNLAILEGHCKPVKSLVAIPGDDSFSVFSGSLDGEIRAWKVIISHDSD
ncbi:hypothetical protein DH2020_042668 [Rehmannia glutinosa]|uniref:Uncharacterized protein n=1 Tax=Rehmannia glutinosa TaxID=99300 RepID=A0ABR0ULT0_REHGL